MAVVHGDKRAGQFAKKSARTYIHLILASLVLLSGIVGTACGVLIGLAAAAHFSWAWHIAGSDFWIALWIWVFALGACVALLRLTDRPFDRLERERIKWLRGGQAEGLIAWYLKDLPKDFHVFYNVMVQPDCDIDHVVIGPTGVFCLSTKSNRGQYSLGADGKYLLNGKETDHVHQAQRLAMQLKDRLAGICGKIPWIQPVLMAPFAFIDFPTRQQKAWVVHEDNLPEVFTDGPIVLKTEDVERFAKAMDMIAEHAKEVFRRPDGFAFNTQS